MTYKELYRKTKNTFLQAGIESPAFDASCLLEHCFGIGRQGLIMNGSQTAPAGGIPRFQLLCERRAKGEPLQYLLGSWDFMGRQFFVGPGVLIPREDTQATVLRALEIAVPRPPSPYRRPVRRQRRDCRNACQGTAAKRRYRA